MKEICCAFFGHRTDLPEHLCEALENTIKELIQVNGVNRFYVGTEGKFDWLTAQVLENLQKQFTNIKVETVLAYLPLKEEGKPRNTLPTLYPEQVAKAPKRFAISRRNEWMLNQSDYVVCYVKYVGGGARQYMEKAIRQKKKVINLTETV